MLQEALHRPATWSEDRTAALRNLWARGLSAKQIASELAVSRNAVLAKAWRHGLARDAPAARSKPQRPPEAQARDRIAVAELVAVVDVIQPGDVARKALVDLEAHECHWPVGQPGKPGFGFCACRRHAGSPYCEAHTQRARVPR